ncbi:hypothetical protein C8U37_102173 [Trichococcus patagoniensis]|uniref:Uncharacterized protein n=1 Tax=Trichococcus patagoniensis TaxID=382641 RepID=A0A2T5IQJ7_9LACT|nr:hypothetical protein C8U37_102173 [Trichococcus patagoniensis]
MMVVRAVVSLEATVFWYEKNGPVLSSGLGRVSRSLAAETAPNSGREMLAGEDYPIPR